MVLLGVYVGFRTITSPFLDVERTTHAIKQQPRVEHAATISQQTTGTWFPDQPWVADADMQFFDEGRSLFCNDFNLMNDDKSVRISPIAILWESEDENQKVPYTLIADAAELKSTRALSPNSGELGRITEGHIAGNVKIQGPKGLSITGRSFHMDETSMKLWSSEPIAFRYEQHHGTAAGGLEIYLDAESPGNGLMSVTDVKLIRLNGKVVCNFHVPGESIKDEALNVQVKAAGGFTFNLLARTATFSGMSLPAPRPLKAYEEVHVKRFHPDGTFDQMVTPLLQLTFRNELSEVTGKDNSMALEHVKAFGRQVVMKSEEHDLLINANNFQYAVDERRIDIRNQPEGSKEALGQVSVTQGTTRLQVPHIQVLHSLQNAEPQRIECNGRGIVEGRGKPKVDSLTGRILQSRFGAMWKKSLVMQLAPDNTTRVITLKGAASVAETTQRFRLSAEEIDFTVQQLKDESVAAAGNSIRSVAFQQPESKTASAMPELDLTNFRPLQMRARDNVTLVSPTGSGTVRKELTVRFEDMLPSNEPPKKSSLADAFSNPDKDPNKPQDKFSFAADTLEAIVGLSIGTDTREAEPRNIWLRENVEVTRESVDPEDSFTAAGNALDASYGVEKKMDIKLFGDPAKVSSQLRSLEGKRIDLAELDSEATVYGSGKIQFTMKKGFDGRSLETPIPLEIFWSDSMTFHERSANFVGNIRVVMDDKSTQATTLTCSGLTVYFKEGMALGQKKQDGSFDTVRRDGEEKEKENPIERIEFHNRVVVKIDEFADKELNGTHRAEFADLNLNLVTGDFDAVGPGFLESVQPDTRGTLQGPAPATVRANTPSKTAETAFVYMRTEFIGSVKGNRQQNMATLTQNVVALVSPIRRVDEKISMDVSIRDLPQKAGFLRAEQLTVSAIDDESKNTSIRDESDTVDFAVVASENARLESKTLAASADVITYDHQKQQFIMRAEGDGIVVVNHRTGPGGALNHTTGRRFEYYRLTDSLSADGFGGLEIGQ